MCEQIHARRETLTLMIDDPQDGQLILNQTEKLPNSEGKNPHNSLFSKKSIDKQY